MLKINAMEYHDWLYRDYFAIKYFVEYAQYYVITSTIALMLYLISRQWKNMKLGLFVKIGASLLLMTGGMQATFLISFLNAFRYAPIYVSIALSFCYLFITTIIVSGIGSKRHPFRGLSGLFIIVSLIALSAIFPILGHNICFCYLQSPNDTITIKSSLGFNTEIYRSLFIEKKCREDNFPCMVYPSHPFNMTDSVFINVHTDISIADPMRLEIWPSQLEMFNSSYFSTVFQFNDLDWQSQRNVHTFSLSNLSPDTTYQFVVFNGHRKSCTFSNIIQKIVEIYTYKTLPTDSNQPLTIVSGGDVGNSQEAQMIWSQLDQYNPDIIFIGGDIAYDNNFIGCAFTWDKLMESYEQLSQRQGRLIPLVMTIGNHDVGINAGSKSYVSQEDNEANPIFFSYYPQHFDANHQIPRLSDRKSYFAHTFGNVVHFSLDSEFITNMEDQTGFIENNVRNGFIHMAQYHDPIYWGCTGLRLDQVVNDKGTQHWTPLFDKYKFATAYENHAHMQKRTLPIINGSVAEGGTVYLGDGSWGTRVVPCRGEDPNYIANWQGKNHVWITQINGSHIHHISIDPTGQQTDQYTQLIQTYNQ